MTGIKKLAKLADQAQRQRRDQAMNQMTAFDKKVEQDLQAVLNEVSPGTLIDEFVLIIARSNRRERPRPKHLPPRNQRPTPTHWGFRQHARHN